MATSLELPSKLVELLSDRSKNPNLTIVDTILFHLGLADIYSLHATSRSLRWLVDYLTDSPRLLDVNKQLVSFVKDPARFRSELGKHDGLIAGDFVRNFFDFGRWEDTRLVIYAQKGPKSQGLTDYLTEFEGYKNGTKHPEVFRRDDVPDLCIVIKTATSSPIVEIINKAQTTADLNMISWNKAYSLLPLPTLVSHKFYPLKPFDNAFGKTLRQYTEQGWTTRDMLWPDMTRELIPQKECHRVGDSRSLIVKLGKTPDGDFTPDYVLEANVFSMLWESDSTHRSLAIGTESVIKSFTLRHTYSNGSKGIACASWKRFLDERLRRWIFVEMIKMDREQRPRGFYFLSPGNYNVTIPSDYKPPGDWDYADDQIIPWFREWERS
ncbi:hypothetical protein ACHAP5_011834 [Fusarium lateritium]